MTPTEYLQYAVAESIEVIGESAHDIHAINQQFQMRQSFVATEGWVLGTMYLVHGRRCDVEVIITGNYHGMDQIPTSVALAVEIDAVQRLTDENHAGYAIHIDGHTFYLPRG